MCPFLPLLAFVVYVCDLDVCRCLCLGVDSLQIRLLNRNVGVRVGGADKFGTLYGSVEHPAGSISVELLKNGFARMVDWSLCKTDSYHN